MKEAKLVVTLEEDKFIRDLKRLLKRAPKTLDLFGWSGTLCVTKENADGVTCVVENDFAMSGDGGDPVDFCQYPDISYE